MKIAYRKKDTSICIFSWLLPLQFFIIRRKLNQYRIVLCAFNYLFLLRTCYERHLTCELWAALVLCFLTLRSNFYPVLWLWLKVSQYGVVYTGNLYRYCTIVLILYVYLLCNLFCLSFANQSLKLFSKEEKRTLHWESINFLHIELTDCQL